MSIMMAGQGGTSLCLAGREADMQHAVRSVVHRNGNGWFNEAELFYQSLLQASPVWYPLAFLIREAMNFGQGDLLGALYCETSDSLNLQSEYCARLSGALGWSRAEAQMVVAALLQVGTTPNFDASIGECLTMGIDPTSERALNWRVLAIEQGRALLITESLLAQTRRYHSSFVPVTWAESQLRNYLNNEFYSSAFSIGERQGIALTENLNSNNPTFATPGGTNSLDRIFLLSATEVEQYLPDDRARAAAHVGAGYWWWLRTPGDYPFNAAIVRSGGTIDLSGNFVYFACGVRPAMWLKI